MKLEVEKILQLLQPGGPLSICLNGYEPRKQQQQMLKSVLEAYNSNKISLIEAGTGTGKSLAYLLPATLWALKHQERTVISTNTISLQEQLMQKDIPLVSQLLGVPFKAVLVKGMNNYLCLRKLHDTQEEIYDGTPEEKNELYAISAWSQQTKEGSRSDLAFVPKHGMWERVKAESDTCNSNECPHYQKCFFFKARREAADAHLLVVNHHLLCADLASRAESDNYSEDSVLPLYQRVVIDEAHHIEDIATEFFSAHVSRIDIMRVLARLASEKQGIANGKVPFLKKKLMGYSKGAPSREVAHIISRLSIDLPALRRELLHLLAEAFQAFTGFLTALSQSEKQDELAPGEKMRMGDREYSHNFWKDTIHPVTKRFLTCAHNYISALRSIHKELEQTKDSKLQEATRSVYMDIAAFVNRLEKSCLMLEGFINQQQGATNRVRWIETQQMQTLQNVHLFDAELDISHHLANSLFNKFSTVVLCSATMTTNKNFDFLRTRLGIIPEKLDHVTVAEQVLDSPFDYSKQALLIVPNDLPPPSHPQFLQEAIEKIEQAVQASHGNAFVLFTSYNMLKTCFEKLAPRLTANRFTLFKQGDEQRGVLLNKFRTTDRAILFGTDSFWEGVDVVGEALRCVIIVKLPFKVPSEPIVQARSEAIVAAGGDPFFDFSIPHAIIKLNQGCGRLIRSKNDQGCIVCLDSRLINKPYGKIILNSLPSFQRLYVKGDEMQARMTEFYRAAYHSRKKMERNGVEPLTSTMPLLRSTN